MTKKEIQSLTGRLATLNRFILRYSDLLQPFFKVIKRANTKGWGPQCDASYLYLSCSATAVTVALVRMDVNQGQRPVYFVNKALSEVEARYSNFE